MSSPRAPQDHLSNFRHTCVICQRIIIDPANSSKPPKRSGGMVYFTNTFTYTVSEILLASQSRCHVFARLMTKFDFSEHEQSRSVYLDLDIASVNVFPEHGFNVKKAKITCRWVGSDESLLTWEDIDDIRCAFEATVGDPAAEFVKGRGSYPYVSTDVTFHVIHRWLRECEDHVECKRTAQVETGPRPSRLLYLDPTDPNRVKIVESGEIVEYAALSYCWGKDTSMQLLRSTLAPWKQSLPLEDLPKTIRDAIFTCRKIGIQNLWVDRLCIIQDDQNDLAKQLSVMVNIYRGSSLTLCAGSAESSADGFLQSRKDAAIIMSETRTMVRYVCPDGTEGTVGLKTKKFQDGEFLPDNIALWSRAWTMQESYLSSRILEFCSNQMVWNCAYGSGAHIYDEDELSFSLEDTAMDEQSQSINDLSWSLWVGEYSNRKLSFSGDKLVAIAALAELYASSIKTKMKLKNPKYVAGLWEHELEASLCWYLDHRKGPSSQQKRPEHYRAPSWSWAAIDGRVTWPFIGSETSITAKVTSFIVQLVSQDLPYGAVVSGSITIRGRLKEDLWNRKTQKLLRTMGKDYKFNDAPDGLIDAIESSIAKDMDGNVLVFCLEIGYSSKRGLGAAKEDPYRNYPFGLILIREGVDSSFYKRVGFFELELLGGTGNFINFNFEGLAELEITII